MNININGRNSVIKGSVDDFYTVQKGPIQNRLHNSGFSDFGGFACPRTQTRNFYWSDYSRHSQCAFQQVTRRDNDFIVKRYLPQPIISELSNAYVLEDQLIKAASVDVFLQQVQDTEG